MTQFSAAARSNLGGASEERWLRLAVICGRMGEVVLSMRPDSLVVGAMPFAIDELNQHRLF